MDRRVVLGLVITVAIVIAGIAILYQGNQRTSVPNATGQNTSQPNPDLSVMPINPPVRDVYINFRNGTPSRIFLVDSAATFGTFTGDRIDQYPPGMNIQEASKGDRFVSIDGMIRNDDGRSLYIALDANLFDRKGNQIGTLLRSSGRPEFKAAWMGLDANDSGDFHLLLKCDKQYMLGDIGRYEVVLAWEPGPTPIP